MTRLTSLLLALAMIGTLLLGGCNRGNSGSTHASAQAGAMTIEADISASTPFMASEAYSEGAIRRVGEAVMKQRLGDRFRIVPIGSRTVDNSIDTLAISSGYKLHLPVARRRVEDALRGLFARNRQTGGEASTNLLYSLENSRPTCNPGSAVYILSDGIESNREVDIARSLASGQPVNLPPPSSAFLHGGCAVWFIGIGASPSLSGGSEVQTLPNSQLQALKAAWRAWLVAAGVAPENIHFETIL